MLLVDATKVNRDWNFAHFSSRNLYICLYRPGGIVLALSSCSTGANHVHRAPTICAILLASSAIFLSAMSVQAGETYYRWTDDKGRPVHSDRPPPKGIDYEVIKTGSGFRRQVDSDEGVVPLSVEPTESNKFKPVDTSKVKIEKNPEFCARGRENLETLDSGVRIRMRNEEGEVVYLGEEDREVQRKRAQDTIEMHCQ
jgi:hypothetical protein